MTEQDLREEICRVGQSLFQRGYAHATAGNISARLDDGFLITPTDACLGTLQPDRLARLDSGGQQISGDRASKTIALHRRIYEATAASSQPAGCVIHTHSTSLVACSLKAFEGGARVDGMADLLPPITPYFVMRVGRVPHIPYHRPGAEEAAEAVAGAIARHAAAGRRLRSVMLARLGPNVWHDSPAAAMAVLEELEETARLWLQTQPAPLDEAQLAELQRVFGAVW
jgi:3-dehydro-4-phosphotetronate decarboxylase